MANSNNCTLERFVKYIPIESIIRKHQEEYYIAIQNCNNVGNSNEFIEFMLKVIDEAIDGMILTSSEETTQETTQKTTQEKIIDLIKKIQVLHK